MSRVLFCALALLLALPAASQPYPSQPIRLIAPFPPGGSVDIMARLISEPVGAQLGGRIVIDNRTGASGNIGMEAAARAKPDGYTVVLNTIPSAGVGTTFHLCGEMLAGQVDMSFPTLSAALPHVKAGTLRALAVTDTKRSSLLPEVPTLQEAGVKDFQFTQWLTLLAPAGTPRDVVMRLNGALRSTLTSKEVRDKFAAQGFEAFITTPEEAGKFIAAEVQRFSRLIKTRKITAE